MLCRGAVTAQTRTPSRQSRRADRPRPLLDREAGGSTDWTTWQATTRPAVDRALAAAGVTGHMGDRDRILFRGHQLTLIEGQLVREDVRSWRVFLFDDETGIAEPLQIRTHAGSLAFSNPTITQIEIDDARPSWSRCTSSAKLLPTPKTAN